MGNSELLAALAMVALREILRPTAARRALAAAVRPELGGPKRRPAQVAQQLEIPATTRGLVIQEVDPYGPAEGVLNSAASGSPDVIVAVEGRAVRTSEDLRAAIREAASNGVISLTVFNQQFNLGQGGTQLVRIQLTDK